MEVAPGLRGTHKALRLVGCIALSVAFVQAIPAQPKPIARGPASAANTARIRIIAIASATYHGKRATDDETRCKRWKLTPQQAVRFFQRSERYDENPYSRFYQTSCAISGELDAEGKRWRFEIDGGGSAIWRHEAEVRHWGCSAPSCEPLVMLLTDLMEG